VSRAHQVPQAHPALLGQKEPGEEEESKEKLETEEIGASWDRQESAANKALWDLQG